MSDGNVSSFIFPESIVLVPKSFNYDHLVPASEMAKAFNLRLFNIGLLAGEIPNVDNIAGAIVSDYSETEYINQLKERHIPMVRIGTFSHEDDNLNPTVLRDARAVGRVAADHFIERHFKHFAYLANKPWRLGKQFYDGYHEHLQAHGYACHLQRIEFPSKNPALDTVVAIADWLKKLPKPLAVFTYSDRSAARVLHACYHAGIAVPDEVAVLGKGNVLSICDFTHIPLSSVAFNDVALAKVALTQLRKLINGAKPPFDPVYISPEKVVLRRSTDTLAVDDPKIATALRYLWDNLSGSLSIDEIAANVGMSRRSLTSAFKKNLGRSINDEMKRRRLEHAQELLKKTNLNVEEICRQIGFKSKNYFHRLFMETFSMTPNAYRVKYGT